MIIDDPRSKFIFLYHPLVLMGRSYTVYQGKEMTNGEVLEYWGKWLVLGEKHWLDELAEKLDPYVERKEIPGHQVRSITAFEPWAWKSV